ncbi:TraB/GumN family protein [Thiocapsa sp.]|uniref:TraB/GumN family protein n=1 Tax=Thiocapsa sp. TaxID=2024551 RepID=UPI0025E4CA25|nr:TraB/GumN family protein [Thiocapsa sp.]
MIAGFLLAVWLAAGSAYTWADPPAIADAPAGSATTRGILFEIRPPTGAPPSYLFGTIHSEDVRVVELPAPVRRAFDASPNIALEVVPDASAIIRAMVTMAYTDGRLLRDVLPADLYLETADALVGIGMPEEAFKDLKPWAVVTLLSSPPSETGEFLDMLLFHRAVADGKRVEGLETMTEQLAVFDTLSETDQINLLRETLATRDQLPLIFEALTAAYVERDIDELQNLSEQHLAESDPRLAALFQEVVIDSRNHRMVERMAPLLAEGGWFIAIGALHLPGDQGVVTLLRKRDHNVTVIF